MGERVAIVGSRGWTDSRAVTRYVLALPLGTIVISGGAEGVDLTARGAAVQAGLSFEEIRPDYRGHRERGIDPRLAPLERNRVIVERCDRLVAFWDGRSSGTANAVCWAVALGKPVEVRRG